MTAHFLLRRLAFLVLCSLFPTAVIHPQQVTHKISFTFDYDFRVTPACSPEVTHACVQQFNFYDISAGIPKRTKLGSIPVPAGATGLVKGISFTTESFLFNPGKHLVAVSAQMPCRIRRSAGSCNGVESDLSKCSTIVKIP